MRYDELFPGGRVLGINPPVYDFAWFDLWARPVGLLRLLGALRDAGRDVSLIDCMYEGRTEAMPFGRWRVHRELREKPAPYRMVPRRYYRFGMREPDFAARLRSLPSPPDVVLVTSVMTYWYPGVFEVVRAVRETYPDARIVLGGVYATLCGEHARASGADSVVRGAVLRGFADLPPDFYDDPGCAVLQTSRGCPMRCDYCASGLLSPAYERRPAADVMRDLRRQMRGAASGDIAFYDDALLWERERYFYPLCAEIRAAFPGVRLHTPNGLHVACLDERCCRELADTGFQTIRLSLEGLDSHVRGASSDKLREVDYPRAVQNLKRAGYAAERVETYILAGIPGQRARDVADAIGYVKAHGGRPKLAEFSPIPGTPLFAAAARATPEIADEPLLHNNTIYTQYVSGAILPDELQALKGLARESR